MSNHNDGGPAFPFQLGTQSGMTLRDYFAAKAMAAVICNVEGSLALGPDSKKNNERVAIVAYAIADAMLAVRNGGKV